MAPGTRHWLNEVESGAVGVFLPGHEHDALYPPGSMYAVVTLPAERLEEIAAKSDLVLDEKTLGGTGIDAKKKFAEPDLFRLRTKFDRIHAGGRGNASDARTIGTKLLDAMIVHFARLPRFQIGGTDPHGLARIVARARAFIHENLDRPLSIDKIASASATSHRTLHRAFQIVLDETPYSYVLKLRLHRIRHELVSAAEIACTITSVANHWGLSELGRFAGWYRDLFGELPSETLARRNQSIAMSYQRMQLAFWQHAHSPDAGAAVDVYQ
jgi:AraC-like DNA-binding protein